MDDGTTVNESRHGCHGEGLKEERVPVRKALHLSHPGKKHGSNLTTIFQYRVYIE
jgi:hypothetical protein